ncbi:MAG: hypothetical protein KAQ83_04105 [Nanoarchaeota archaeon]|nr:hypothetical protein [Nanoarchaeota archaeon]
MSYLNEFLVICSRGDNYYQDFSKLVNFPSGGKMIDLQKLVEQVVIEVVADE